MFMRGLLGGFCTVQCTITIIDDMCASGELYSTEKDSMTSPQGVVGIGILLQVNHYAESIGEYVWTFKSDFKF